MNTKHMLILTDSEFETILAALSHWESVIDCHPDIIEGTGALNLEGTQNLIDKISPKDVTNEALQT